jgi:Uma2 family endonuclease
MNQHSPPETMQRHQFTLEDVLELIAQGLVDRRVQLLEGEIYDMPLDSAGHARCAMGIGRVFMTELFGKPYFVGVQTTLRLKSRVAPSPDIFILSGRLPDKDVPSDNVLLVIEVADTSLRENLTNSAARYARHGVREYWVVDVNAPCIHVHQNPVDGVYPPPRRVEANEAIAPLHVPGVSIRLADIA